MPSPTLEHQRLSIFCGHWQGQEILHPTPWSPNGSRARGTFEYALDLGGLFLHSRYRQEVEGHEPFEGRGYYGWNAESQRYVMHWLDSGGGGGLMVEGDWEKGQWTYVSPKARYLHRVDNDTYYFQLLIGDDCRPFIEGTYRRL